MCDDFVVQDVENFTITSITQYGGFFTTDEVAPNIQQWNVEVSINQSCQTKRQNDHNVNLTFLEGFDHDYHLTKS
jgi:hypothetical protein